MKFIYNALIANMVAKYTVVSNIISIVSDNVLRIYIYIYIDIDIDI